jgi:hypothetical protein
VSSIKKLSEDVCMAAYNGGCGCIISSFYGHPVAIQSCRIYQTVDKTVRFIAGEPVENLYNSRVVQKTLETMMGHVRGEG